MFIVLSICTLSFVVQLTCLKPLNDLIVASSNIGRLKFSKDALNCGANGIKDGNAPAIQFNHILICFH